MKPAQLPLAQGTCLPQAAASTSVVNSRQIRSGVQNSARPVTACRPHGPPTASLAWTATGSVQVGTTRSGQPATGRAADATDPSGREPEGSVGESSEGAGVTAPVCRAGSAGPDCRCRGLTTGGRRPVVVAAGVVATGVPSGVPSGVVAAGVVAAGVVAAGVSGGVVP